VTAPPALGAVVLLGLPELDAHADRRELLDRARELVDQARHGEVPGPAGGACDDGG